MFKGKTLIDFTNLFSRHNFRKNDEVILNDFLRKNINMNRLDVYHTKQIFHQSDITVQMRLSRNKEIEDFFIAENQ